MSVSFLIRKLSWFFFVLHNNKNMLVLIEDKTTSGTGSFAVSFFAYYYFVFSFHFTPRHPENIQSLAIFTFSYTYIYHVRTFIYRTFQSKVKKNKVPLKQLLISCQLHGYRENLETLDNQRQFSLEEDFSRENYRYAQRLVSRGQEEYMQYSHF